MIQVNCDGGIRGGNPGGTPSWAWVRREEGKIVKYASGLVPRGRPLTNNVAEYYAVLHALQALVDDHLEDRPIELRGDSQLILRQLKGEFAVNSPELRPLHEHAMGLLLQFSQGVTLTWVPRKENGDADALAGDALEKYRRPPPAEEDIVR